MSQTAAQLLVRCLEVNGFQRGFGVPGESYLDLLDALYDSPIKFITCRHEGGAAMAACAHGQLTAQPGLAMVTRGPGVTNASSGLHAARQGGVAMLLLAGQIAREERHRLSFQEMEYANIPNDLVKWSAEISSPDRIPEYIARAMHVMRSGYPGPVLLALPEDMLGDPVKTAPIRACSPSPAKMSPDCSRRIRDVLAKSERPFLLLGGTGWTDEASAAIAHFAKVNQVPVGFSFRAQDCLDNDHQCACGPLGIGGNADFTPHLEQADLIILNGCRAGNDIGIIDRVLHKPNPQRTLVHLHPDPEEPGRVFQPDIAAILAPADAAEALGEIDVGATAARAKWRQACRSIYEEFSALRNDPDWYLSAIVAAMREVLPPNAILCNGAGNANGWLHRFFRYHQPGTALGPVSGSMGYDVPAALAASLENPGTPVISWSGDGTFLMTCQELATALQFGAVFTVVVIDNGLLGTIRMHQEVKFPGRVSGTEIQNPDFVALAESFGAYAERADSVEIFQAALERCLASRKPSLIHLPVDPRVLAPGMLAAG